VHFYHAGVFSSGRRCLRTETKLNDMRRNSFDYAWREGGFRIPDNTIGKNMCKKDEENEFRITDPSNRLLSAGIVEWVNSMKLSFSQRNAFTLALANQGVFYLHDVSLLDIEAVMHRISTVTSRFMAVWTPDEARHFSEKLSAERFALIAQRTDGSAVCEACESRWCTRTVADPNLAKLQQSCIEHKTSGQSCDGSARDSGLGRTLGRK